MIQSIRKNINKEKLREEYIKIKDYSIRNLINLKSRAFKRLRENGCEVYEVKDSKQAISIIKNIIGDNFLVKSKTNVSKEINLKKELKKSAIEVIETDLGDRLVQLANLPLAHPILPSLCISKEYAYELLTKKKLLQILIFL